MNVSVPLALTVLSLATIGFGPQTEGRAAQNSNGRQPRDRGQAAIVGSGSGTLDGFRILVDRSGRTQSIVVPRSPNRQPVELPVATIGTVAAALALRLYSDLDAAWPLSSLPKQHCTKGSSGGTLTIEFDGQTTPDLSCGGGTNSKLRALAQDLRQIVNASGKQQTGGR